MLIDGNRYMREGFENDDIYVMVEDEFLTTAGTFTRHLHEAEYARRKKLARIENATVIGDIARPTGPNAKMSTETKMNIEAKATSAKHKTALDQINNDVVRPPVDSEVEGDEDEDEDDDADDPWIGTHLQALMTSPRKSRSLVGLEGVRSTTRAALGYAGSSSHGAARDTSPTVVQEDRTASGRQPPPSVVEVDEETSSGDDDDLGVSSKPKTVEVGASPPGVVHGAVNKSGKPSDSSRGPVLARPHDATKFDSSSTAAPPSSKLTYKSRMYNLFDDIDDRPAPKIKSEGPSPRKGVDKQLTSVSLNRPREQNNNKSRKDRLNQVPTFL